MNRVEHRHEPYYNDLGCRALSHKSFAGRIIYAVLMLTATWTPCVLTDAQAYEYLGPTSLVSPTKVPTDASVPAVRHKVRYHTGVENLELEQAVIRAAQQHHIQPALLLALKAESSFNPIVISRAGAVGLMQLVPETAIRHGVRNLYDANENISGGPSICVTS